MGTGRFHSAAAAVAEATTGVEEVERVKVTVEGVKVRGRVVRAGAEGKGERKEEIKRKNIIDHTREGRGEKKQS